MKSGKSEEASPRSMGRSRQILQLFRADIAKPHFVTVMLENDVAFGFGHKGRELGEFRALNGCAQLRIVPFVFDNFGSIEPVFHMALFVDDAALVPFTDGFESLVAVGRN